MYTWNKKYVALPADWNARKWAGETPALPGLLTAGSFSCIIVCYQISGKFIKGYNMKYLTCAALALFCGFCAVQAKTVDRILAQVNEDIVTLSDLNRKIAEYRAQLETKYSGEELAQMMQKAEKQALEQLVQDKLLDQKAAELGPSSDIDSRVSTAIQQIMQENKIKSMDDLEKALMAQQGMNMRDFRDMLRKQFMREDLVSGMVGSRIALLSQEIEKFYKDHLADYSIPEEVTLSEIDIPVENSSQEAESRINDIYGRLLKGEAFAVLASQYSKGITASKGGSTGTIRLSMLNSATRNAIDGLKEGDISKPQKVSNPKSGDLYVIYRIDARKPVSVRPIEEVRPEIKNRLYNQKFNPEYERFINQLKENAYIQYFDEIKEAGGGK
jgi:peptidyl-prolyl cis-trans isomerase SurA